MILKTAYDLSGIKLTINGDIYTLIKRRTRKFSEWGEVENNCRKKGGGEINMNELMWMNNDWE